MCEGGRVDVVHESGREVVVYSVCEGGRVDVVHERGREVVVVCEGERGCNV